MLTHPRFALFRLLAALLALGAALGGCSHAPAPAPGTGPQAPASSAPPLKVGIIPFEDVDKIATAFKPFASYLGRKAGRGDGQVFVTPSYAGVLTALQSDQIDCAYLNPLSYTLAVQQFAGTPEKLTPIGMPYFHHSLTYKGIIFVRADSGIRSLKDLKGKSFAFADRTSTSGYLYPAGLMKEAGLDPDKDIKAVNISGNAGVMAVMNGQAAGGATYQTGIEQAFTDPVTKTVDAAKVAQFKIIATTDPIPNGMLVARGNLDPATVDALRRALVSINTDADGKAALQVIPWDKIVPPDDHLFDSVRKKATILGLNLQSLDQQKK